MSAATLHYIYDPLCGWCYGAKPLVQAAQAVVSVVGHAGGMMTGAQRQKVSSQLRDYVMPHDRRIAEYTGQPFGEAYFEGLLRDSSAVFDSAPPIAAVLAAQALGEQGLALLGRLQTAHYLEGRRIADKDVLLALAQELGFAAEAFAAAFDQALAEQVPEHIKHSRALLAQLGGQGFPTLALEQDGQFRLIDIGPWLGKPEAFGQWLKASLGSADSISTVGTQACSLDGCAL